MRHPELEMKHFEIKSKRAKSMSKLFFFPVLLLLFLLAFETPAYQQVKAVKYDKYVLIEGFNTSVQSFLTTKIYRDGWRCSVRGASNSILNSPPVDNSRRYCKNRNGKIVHYHQKYNSIKNRWERHGPGIELLSDRSVSKEGIWEEGKFLRQTKTNLSENDYGYYDRFFTSVIATCGPSLPNYLQCAYINSEGFLSAPGINSFQVYSTASYAFCRSGNCISGNGVKEYPTGGVYSGFFSAGKRHGEGRYLYNNKTNLIYIGGWKNGDMHGQGVLFNDSTEYEGGFSKGKRHGQGRQVYESGAVYEGNWVAGQRHGQGRMARANGSIQKGEWISGKFKEKK